MEGLRTTSPNPDKLPFIHAECTTSLVPMNTELPITSTVTKKHCWNSDNSELISGHGTAKCYWSEMNKMYSCSSPPVFTCSIEQGSEDSDPCLRDRRSQSQGSKRQLLDKKLAMLIKYTTSLYYCFETHT